MIRFLDGPAAGHTLMLRSAPDFLRVTHAPGPHGGKWDALDQPHDQPEPEETLFVYRRVTRIVTVHVNARPKFMGFVAAADYTHVTTADGGRFRDPAEWSRFVRTEPFEEPSAEPMQDREAAVQRVMDLDREATR